MLCFQGEKGSATQRLHEALWYRHRPQSSDIHVFAIPLHGALGGVQPWLRMRVHIEAAIWRSMHMGHAGLMFDRLDGPREDC